MISNRNNHWFALVVPCVEPVISRRLDEPKPALQKALGAGFIRRSGHCLVLCALLFSWSIASGAAAARQDQVLTDGWKFIKDDAGLAAATGSWQSVTIPHTWNTKSGDEGDHKGDPHSKPGYYRGACWYAKSLDIPADWAGQARFHPFRGRVTGLEGIPQRPAPGGTSRRLYRVLL